MYDRSCAACGATQIDCWEPVTPPTVHCSACGAATTRAWLQHAAAVIGDDIPGGIEIRHGICHDDGSPKRYYSKSEMVRAAAEKGLVNYVRHVPDRGSDKSKETTRWY